MIYVRQVIASHQFRLFFWFIVLCFQLNLCSTAPDRYPRYSQRNTNTLCVCRHRHTLRWRPWRKNGVVFRLDEYSLVHTHPYTGAACSRIDQELKLLTRCERSRVIFRIHSRWLMRCVTALLNEVERVNHDNIQEESKFARFYACHAHLNSSRPKMKKTKAANWLFSSCNFAPRKNVQCSWCLVAATRAGISVVFASFFLHWP